MEVCLRAVNCKSLHLSSYLIWKKVKWTTSFGLNVFCKYRISKFRLWYVQHAQEKLAQLCLLYCFVFIIAGARGGKLAPLGQYKPLFALTTEQWQINTKLSVRASKTFNMNAEGALHHCHVVDNRTADPVERREVIADTGVCREMMSSSNWTSSARTTNKTITPADVINLWSL